MPWKCINCKYETEEYEGKECPDCGGLLDEAESKVDWLAEKEEKDLNDPNKSDKENADDDVTL